MIMDVRKQMWSVVRVVLPFVGFALICMGCLQNELTHHEYTWRVILAYIMIVLGFLAILAGVFWTICQSMKSKMYQRGGRQRQMQIYTIERPSSFPPSYEQSQQSRVCADATSGFVMVDEGAEVSLAPPLYSRDASEAPDCRWSWERPPPYSQEQPGASGH